MKTPHPDHRPSTPPPRNVRRAAVSVLAILAAVILAVFVLRQFWHADTQQDDPASLAAPDRSPVEGQAPAE